MQWIKTEKREKNECNTFSASFSGTFMSETGFILNMSETLKEPFEDENEFNAKEFKIWFLCFSKWKTNK